MRIYTRFLIKKDAIAYRALRLNSYQESPLAFSESYQDEQSRSIDSFEKELVHKGNPPEWFVLGAFTEEDHLIGFVKFRRDQRSKARHKSMVHAMYVAPEFRGLQVGNQLMEEIIELAKAMAGLEQIHLWVLHANGQTAANFYSKLGFIKQGPLVLQDLKYGETYIDAQYMVLYF